ncbi:ATP-binding protein [Parapedobacter defluvii]|uniref:sensor histidine kinase n=1 Tax=Parapedobacter defluvii TaxID=2045106 RepID=UPI00333E4C58
MHNMISLLTTLALSAFLLIMIPSNVQAQEQFNDINQAYHQGQLTDTSYLKRVDSLTSHLLAQGVFFPVDTLLHHLKLYQNIAWNRNVPGHFRVDYYLIQLNNAHMANLRGAAMYFAEKVTQEADRQNDPRPLIELAVKTYIFSIQKNYKKIIQTYKKSEQAVHNVLHILQSDTTAFKAGLDALQVLSAVMNAYANLKDTAQVMEVYTLATQIGKQLTQRYPVNRGNMLLADFALLEFDFVLASIQQDYGKAERLLDEITALKETYSDQATGFIDYNLMEWRTGHYIHIGNLDSAAIYVKRYETTPTFSDTQPAVVNTYKARLAALQNNYKQAYELLGKALEENGKAQSTLMEELDDLLYAYTEAESNKLALEHAEREKRKHIQWIVAISALAIAVVLGVYLYMRKEKQQAKNRIASLQEIANAQIASMEEIKAQAIQEEQKRLARELHDGLSSTLAGIKHQLDLLCLTNPSNPLVSRLASIENQVNDAYAIARGKSHQWYQDAELFQETLFKTRIEKLLDTAFRATNGVSTNVQVDDYVLGNVQTEMKIELLRIIQESITNILKHAKAKTVSVLLYGEGDHLILTISDDGRGWGSSSRNISGLGIRSIYERAKNLGGTANIRTSTTAGTEVEVSIPLSSS